MSDRPGPAPQPEAGTPSGSAAATNPATPAPAAPAPAAPAPAAPGRSTPAPSDLAARIADLGLADAHRLRRRLSQVRRLKTAQRTRELAKLDDRIARAERAIATRRAAIPQITYPRELPVTARVGDLKAAIQQNQVVIVAGETGSGKSTQLPKICLDLGRGVKGLIGHTQPRRIAARTLAERIAHETETQLGGAIGYTIRFGDHTGPRTAVKLMTDGILLAEIAADPDLMRYDTIIIDEAHERSLNIDFLLGYLVRLLPRRPDLKLIITSATIDPEKFSRHFADAPIVEVSGRTFPVEIRYRPYGLGSDDESDDDGDESGTVINRAGNICDDPATDTPPGHAELDQTGAILAAVDELLTVGDGDILIFLSGEREITDTADALTGHLRAKGVWAAGIEVLPLYGRLSMADQHRVFAPTGRRRIVLATNVAETSLTVPGIRYVVDPGTARISRYSPRTKVQRLPIEKISQASAGQRAGRCGRVADGICIRLYSQADFEGRGEFTDPEIARTSLASVLLKMAALGLGEVETFPFLDPPDRKQITDGLTVLGELGALQQAGGAVKLTEIGRTLAALPVDPRLARMLVEADKRGCLAEMLVIVSALAIRDVREYPLDAREKATAWHSRFADAGSDFVAFVSLWHYLEARGKALSGNRFRKMCKAEYLHFLRIREWQDLHGQLTAACRGLGMRINASARISQRAPEQRGSDPVRGSEAIGVDGRALHTALAAGLLSHIGSRIERDKIYDGARGGARGRRPLREYQGTRGTTFAIWPGSALAKTPAPFVLAAELVETSRLWARTVAAIDPSWVEEVGGELVKRSYSEPHWSAKRQAALASEKVMLLGVTLIPARKVPYGRIDPEHARELLIRHGLVEGALTGPALPFLDANQAALREVADIERRMRRDIAVDDDTLFALYDQRLPADITSGRALEAWWRKAPKAERAALSFTAEQLIAADAELAHRDQYPDQLDAGPLSLDLDYVFAPGAADDGVSATVPLAALATIDPEALPAQVPGLRRDLALALIKSLPKQLRRSLVPAPDFADAALERIGDQRGALPDRLAEALTQLSGVPVTVADFDYGKVPDHLRMRFTVVDDAGRTVATGTDLPTLARQLRPDTRQAVAAATPIVEQRGLTAFPADGIDRTVTTGAVSGFPALADEGDSVALTVFLTAADQARAMRGGLNRLLTLALNKQITALAGSVKQLAAPRGPAAPGAKTELTRGDLMRLSTAPHGGLPALVRDAATAAIAALYDWAGCPTYTAAAFDAAAAKISGQLDRAVTDILIAYVPVLTAAARADAAIAALGTSGTVINSLKAEYAAYLRPDMITEYGAAYLPDVARYLTALAVRAERIPERATRDAVWAAEIDELTAYVDARVAELRPERQSDPDVRAARRMIAEYRVALFAQPMRAAMSVSPKRIRAAADALPD